MIYANFWLTVASWFLLFFTLTWFCIYRIDLRLYYYNLFILLMLWLLSCCWMSVKKIIIHHFWIIWSSGWWIVVKSKKNYVSSIIYYCMLCCWWWCKKNVHVVDGCRKKIGSGFVVLWCILLYCYYICSTSLFYIA